MDASPTPSDERDEPKAAGGGGQGLSREEQAQRDKIEQSKPIQEEAAEMARQPGEEMYDEDLNPGPKSPNGG